MDRPLHLSSGSDGSHLDLRSHIAFFDDALQPSAAQRSAPFWNSVHLHERAHWIRLRGSSVGLLLALLQRARIKTAEEALSLISKKQGLDLINHRKESAIWSYKTGYEPGLAGEDFALYGQFWLDLRYAADLIFDSDRISGFPWHGADSIRCAIADAWNFSSGLPGYLPFPGNSIAEAFLQGDVTIEPFPQYSWVRTFRKGVEGIEQRPLGLFPSEPALTTRLLWECASSLDEMAQALRLKDDIASHDPDLIRLLNLKMSETSYGLPWQLARHMCGLAGTTALLFLIAVDIAMNPPLPFLEPLKPQSWEDFYPPSRFLKAYQVIAEISSLHEINARNADILWARKVICEQSGMLYGKLDEACQEHGNLSSLLKADEKVGFLNAIACISHKLMDVRYSDPLSLVYPRTSRVLTFTDTQEGIDHALCFTPPISAASDGMYVATGFPSGDVVTYLETCVVGNLTEQFVSDTGEYDLSFLPANQRVGHEVRFSWQ